MPSFFSTLSDKGRATRTLIAVTAAVLMLQPGFASVAGIAAAATSNETDKTHASQSASIYNTYQSMLKKKNGLPAADRYLASNIKRVTSHHASLMVLQLENARLKALSPMTDRMLVPNVQAKLLQAYRTGDSFTKLMSRIDDAAAYNLLQEARDNGYKLIMLEGALYPIMNYAAFQKYNQYVKPDIADYINIMAAETRKIPAEDGDLLIGYQEMLLRALSQEHFLKLYPDSKRSAQVQSLFDSYTQYTFYGLINTPLFDYETNKMTANAQKGYKAVIERLASVESPFLEQLADFLDVAAASNFEKTPAVERWLEKHVPASE
ncbi:hypothetical protein [Paenibacillus sp. JJ-223]|uniref:hypothetical protein n=1 Tax=Paenibacillus sp. JJ-223 TaxID=2905647 RepID=UPI001F1AA4DF|nr:hypothetical protein [Paenibacillus sp. JJ-223]CAH1221769.1 hypothetical protein PAECIP111890_05284 [Paenibacillus sp. JJ-223]